MDYQQAINASKQKRVLGLALGVLALTSIFVSFLKFFYLRMHSGTELGMVLAEPYRNLISTFYDHTPFLNFFWEYSPVPDLVNVIALENFFFLIIFMIFFVGLALETAGDKIASSVATNMQEAGVERGGVPTVLESTGVRLIDQRRELIILPAITLLIAIVVLKAMGF